MHPLPHAAPISDMHNHQAQILSLAQSGPVMLTARGRTAAVLLSPEKWNSIAVRLRNLELLLEAKRIEMEMERAPSRVIIDEELERQLAEKVTQHVAH